MDQQNFSLSHQLAVNAYLINGNKFLLLKRKKAPRIWVPPGGRLNVNEDPLMGLRREIREETCLEIEIICPANTWFGRWQNSWLLSIDYLVKWKSGTVLLSDEHSDYDWVSLEELEKGDPVQLIPDTGFQYNDFKYAFQLYNLLQGNASDESVTF
jgi:8-oxo-dGTP diphosphatase